MNITTNPILTKEELAAIRARCEAATSGLWKTEEEYSEYRIKNQKCYIGSIYSMEDAIFVAHARQDITALLDALKAEEKRVEEIFEAYKRINECKCIMCNKSDCTMCRVATIEYDRDKWKARAEALEMAIKDEDDICNSCQYIDIQPKFKCEPCSLCCNDGIYDKWILDESRIIKKE